ncbi:MAG: hypothetical protein WBC33_03785 [Conexibacter sp.]
MRARQLLLVASLALGVALLAAAGCGSADHTATAKSWLGFGVDRWPGADWRPYADSSPFNQPIAARVRVHPRSRAIVARLLSWGPPASLVAGANDTPDDYAHPTYYAKSTDPLYRLRSTHSWSRSPIDGARIRIPSAARPASGGDGHMTVVESDGWEYDFWRVSTKPRGGGTLRYEIGGRIRIDGSGLRAKGTAAGFGNLAGIIRAPELAAGRIDHALFLVVRCTSRDRSFGYGVQRRHQDGSFVYPASAGAARCGSGDADAPPTGARLQLAMSDAQIDGLALPAWKQAILRALARYGGYVGDTGGPGFGVMIESSTTYTAFGRPDLLLRFAQQRHATGLDAVDEYFGRYTFDLADGVDWARYLRVVVPPKR